MDPRRAILGLPVCSRVRWIPGGLQSVPPPRPDQPSGRFPVIQSIAGDSALVEKALAGDRHSFDLLVDKYYKVLFNGALRMVNDTEDARDIVQVTFLKAYEKLHTF